MPTVRLSPRASVAKGSIIAVLRPRMAMDAAVPDLTSVAQLLGKKGFDKAQAATLIRQASAGLLAQDADLDDIQEVLEALTPILDKEEDEGEDTEANSSFPMRDETEDAGWDRRARDARTRLGRDETEEECEERERREAANDARMRMGRDESEEERKEREAKDKRARDSRRTARDAKRARDETDEEKKKREEAEEGEAARLARSKEKEGEDKRAMDAAIDVRVNAARQTERDIAVAREDVRPWVGTLPASLAFDSVPEVYKKALDMLGVDMAGVDASAYKVILHHVPTPGSANRRPLAMDAALPGGVKSAAERFNTGHIKVMG